MSQGGRIVLFLSVFLLAACGKKQDVTRWNSFPVAIYSGSTLSANPEMQADLQDAMDFWEAKAGRKLFDYRGTWSGGVPYIGSAWDPSAILGNVIFFQNPWSFAPDFAGQTVIRSENGEITNAISMINPGVFYCSGDCAGQDYFTSERKTFAHELGHFLGLAHAQDTNDIMYPSIQPGGSLAAVSVDLNSLQNLTIP